MVAPLFVYFNVILTMLFTMCVHDVFSPRKSRLHGFTMILRAVQLKAMINSLKLQINRSNWHFAPKRGSYFHKGNL